MKHKSQVIANHFVEETKSKQKLVYRYLIAALSHQILIKPVNDLCTFFEQGGEHQNKKISLDTTRLHPFIRYE